MKLSKTKRIHSIGFNMTPMIDIVFLLIIFFMTVSQITRGADHPLQLPTVDEGASELVTTTVSINLDSGGELIISGEPMSLDRLERTLLSQIAQVGNDPNRVKIQIRCDRRCPSDNMNRLVNKLSELGFTRVQIAVSGEEN